MSKQLKLIDVSYGGEVRRILASLETILSLGAINTPTLLMQSGVGDEAELTQFGIPSSKLRHIHRCLGKSSFSNEFARLVCVGFIVTFGPGRGQDQSPKGRKLDKKSHDLANQCQTGTRASMIDFQPVPRNTS